MAAGLTVGSFGGWTLPSITDTGSPGCDFSFAGGTDCGYNVDTSGSAMAYLWYEELGNLAFCPPGDAPCAGGPQPGWGLTNTGPYQNMQSNAYWSGTGYAPNTSFAWYFLIHNGLQGDDVKRNPLFAVAVRPGDVAASVPEPGSLAMLLAGLGALAAARRRRTR